MTGPRVALLLTCTWPPIGGPGTLRTYKFVQHLPRYGWRTVVITPDARHFSGAVPLEQDPEPPGAVVVRTEFRSSFEWLQNRLGSHQRCLTARGASSGSGSAVRSSAERPRPPWRRAMSLVARHLLAFPDTYRQWLPTALKEAQAAIAMHRPEVLVTTSPPETPHLVGRIVHERTGLPWVAELRDPWLDYHHETVDPLFWLRQRQVERSVLGRATRLITLAEEWATLFGQRVSVPCDVIRSGYDEDDVPAGAAFAPQVKPLVLLYPGKLHPTKQTPEPLFASLALLRSRGLTPAELRVEFLTYGNLRPDFETLAERYKVRDWLDLGQRVPYGESLVRQRQAGALLLFDWLGDDAVSRGVIPLKFYEYLSARRPVLLFGAKRGELVRLAEANPACRVVWSAEEGAAMLGAWCAEAAALGDVRFHTDPANIALFTRQRAAQQLAEVLDRVARTSEGPSRHPENGR